MVATAEKTVKLPELKSFLGLDVFPWKERKYIYMKCGARHPSCRSDCQVVDSAEALLPFSAKVFVDPNLLSAKLSDLIRSSFVQKFQSDSFCSKRCPIRSQIRIAGVEGVETIANNWGRSQLSYRRSDSWGGPHLSAIISTPSTPATFIRSSLSTNDQAFAGSLD